MMRGDKNGTANKLADCNAQHFFSCLWWLVTWMTC